MPAREWYYEVDGHIQGPIAEMALIKLARSGQLLPDQRIRCGASGRWTPARRTKGLYTADQYREHASTELTAPVAPALKCHSGPSKPRQALGWIGSVAVIVAIGGSKYYRQNQPTKQAIPVPIVGQPTTGLDFALGSTLNDSPLDVTPLPSVDEQLFLVRLLEFLIEVHNASLLSPAEVDSSLGSRSFAEEVLQYQKAKQLDSKLIDAYSLFIQMTDEGLVFRRRLNSIDRQATTAKSHAQQQSLFDAGFSGAHYGGAIYNEGADSSDAILGAVALGGFQLIMESAATEARLGEDQRLAIETEASRYVKRAETLYARIKTLVQALANERNWRDSEVGFDLELSTDQQARLASRVEQGDFRELLRFAALARERRPRDPFAKELWLQLSVLVDRADCTSAQCRLWAQDYIHAARLVPAGPLFDKLRASLVEDAAALITTAAAKEVGSQAISSGPFAQAQEIVQVWQTYLYYNPLDAEGWGSRGMSIGYAFGRDLDRSRSHADRACQFFSADPQYTYFLAMLHGAAGDSKSALQWLKTAFQNGYGEVAVARIDPDLESVRSQLPEAFKDATAVKSRWSFEWSGLWSSTDSITLTNDSLFPLTRLQFHVTFSSDGFPTWEESFALPELKPGASHTWQVRIESRGANVKTDSRLQCDQGI